MINKSSSIIRYWTIFIEKYFWQNILQSWQMSLIDPFQMVNLWEDDLGKGVNKLNIESDQEATPPESLKDAEA